MLTLTHKQWWLGGHQTLRLLVIVLLKTKVGIAAVEMHTSYAQWICTCTTMAQPTKCHCYQTTVKSGGSTMVVALKQINRWQH